jgi:hypothetical protein
MALGGARRPGDWHVMTRSKKPRPGLTGETLGGILAGFDQQIMRTTPPPHELVQKGAPVRGLSGDDGGPITIHLAERPAHAGEPGMHGSAIPSTADLMDERADEHDVCDLPFRQYGAVRRFTGRVRTVRCHENNVLLRQVLETPGEGRSSSSMVEDPATRPCWATRSRGSRPRTATAGSTARDGRALRRC